MIFSSLRWRLITASVVVEVILLGVLIYNSHRILHAEFSSQVADRVAEVGPLLEEKGLA